MIRLRDKTIGSDYQRFHLTPEGFHDAYKYIKQISELGHEAAGDVRLVEAHVSRHHNVATGVEFAGAV